MQLRISVTVWIIALLLCGLALAQETTQPLPVSDSLKVELTPVDQSNPRANMVHVDGRELNWRLGKRGEKSAPRTCGSFSIDRTEVTNRDFAQFLSAADSNARFYDPRMDIIAGPHQFVAGSNRENYPVAYVDWMGAFAFAGWAGKSLPTEEEWIVAALDARMASEQDTLYPWGNLPLDSTRGNFLIANGFPGRTAVGTFPAGATPSNVMDLAGNVAEWTVTENTTNLPAGGTHSWMVVKGGSFLDTAPNVTVSSRALRDRSERLGSLGFRCIIRDQPAK